MPKKMKKGYFVQGEFVAEGSERDLELKAELKGSDTPSRTELKAQSAALQTLGEQLLSLRADLLNSLQLPGQLLDALSHAAGLTNFEARRRQMQFIGKLMRKLDSATLDLVRHALDTQAMGPAADTLLLHQAEQWRDGMVQDDALVARWIDQHPATDIQHLRALVRQVRKEASPEKPGMAVRKGRAFRDLFQLIRDGLGLPDKDGDSLATPSYQSQKEAS